jgi:phosphate-selective porin OprO/OprP
MADGWKDRLRYESDDGNFRLRLGGRLHADTAFYDADVTPLEDGSELRRARLNIAGRVLQDWRFRFEYDFAASNDFRIKDAWVGYNGFDRLVVRAGNQQEPLSLEELTSSNYITFMERALPNALVPGYKLGGTVRGWGERWSLTGGIFEGEIRGRETGMTEGWGLAGRTTMAPILSDSRLFHLGMSGEYRKAPGDHQARYSSRPESHVTDERFVNTGRLSDVDHTWTLGAEAALVQGPWSLQGEYLGTALQRDGRQDLWFDGWYVFVSWLLTGERRPYDHRRGVFTKIKPHGRIGAWELALRYSTLDLENARITGGHERNVTLGLNWYPNRNTRLMANLVWIDADPSSDGIDERPSVIQFRAQFYF